jgi:hypothetical protein
VGWNQVNGSGGKDSSTATKKRNTLINGASSPGGAGHGLAKRDGTKENKVAYILFYRKID